MDRHPRSTVILQRASAPPPEPTRWAHICERCGEPMEERQCKIVCRNCGAFRDCSDP